MSDDKINQSKSIVSTLHRHYCPVRNRQTCCSSLSDNPICLLCLELGFSRLYKQSRPERVCEECWQILFTSAPFMHATALWQLDSDSTLYIVAHRGLPSKFLFMRLPKMDTAIGKIVMVIGKPLLLFDVLARPSEDNSLIILSPLEKKILRELGARTVIVLPHEDYALMLCFSEVLSISEETFEDLSRFTSNLVTAYKQAHLQSHNDALIKLGKILTPSAIVSPVIMDQVAGLIRNTTNSDGASIFLRSRDWQQLQLVGTTGIQGSPPYEEVVYPLKHGEGIIPEVVLRKKGLRYPNLETEGAEEELRKLGYTWENRWPETSESEIHDRYAIMVVPLIDEAKACLGAIRISLYKGGCSFSPQVEYTLTEIADRVASFISETRLRSIQSMKTMHSIAHQIISPLNALRWHCLVLKRSKLSSERQSVAMRSIYNLASLAATYGENFEQVARILSGDMKDFEFRPTKITPLLVKLARDYQPLAWQQNKGIEVAVKDEPGSLDNLPDVLVDKNSLIHAFSCVFDNAIKYATPNSTIRISGEKLIDKVQIHVDNVSLFHLPDNWTSRIFEAGVRHPEAIDIDPAGTGIGLWLAQRILHLHGGEIIALPSVLSKEIKGGWNTRFTFFLKTNLSYWSSLLSDLSKEIMRVE